MNGGITPLKRLKMYSQLSKDKLSLWIVISTLPGYFACGGPLALAPLATLAVGTGLASASANAFNQTYERNRDKVMNRTMARPVASGRLSAAEGYTFGTLAGVAGTGLLAAGCGPTVAALGFSNIFAYAGMYTPMKVLSPYNTHIGALVGSVPVLMGCAAAGAPLLSPVPICLFVAQTLWQFPHFYALAWLFREDYTRGGFNMFPLSDETGKETAKMIKPWLYATVAYPVVTSLIGWTNPTFILCMMIPNGVMVHSLYKFEKEPSKQGARQFFFHSLWQLFALLGLTAVYTKNAQRQWMDEIAEEEEKTKIEKVLLKRGTHAPIVKKVMAEQQQLLESIDEIKREKGETLKREKDAN